MAEISGVAIAFFPHHVEHLVPICAIMGMALIPLTIDGNLENVNATKYYPDVIVNESGKVSYWAMHELLPQLSKYDAIFYSHLCDRAKLRQWFASYNSTPHIVHCPHGFSEKKQVWAAKVAYQDIVLLPGQHALDQLCSYGVIERLSNYYLTGNYRYAYYKQNYEYFSKLINQLALNSLPSRTNILYAPTWKDAINSSSAFDAMRHLIDTVPESYNLIIKLHPHLEAEVSLIEWLMRATDQKKNIAVIRNNPLIYPILEVCDIYIGDMSSLAYDYLIFNRPMFFLNQTSGTEADSKWSKLFECGVVVEPEEYKSIYKIIDSALHIGDEIYADKRSRLYNYTFSESQSINQMRKGIERSLSAPLPGWLRPRAKIS